MIILKRLRHILLLSLFINTVGIIPVAAQDPHFSQFYAVPLYLNPAFTGNTELGRLATTYRNQWTKVPNAYTSYAFSYDHFIDEFYSGLGLMVMRDQSGDGDLTFTDISGLYSFLFSITRNNHIRAGIRGSYVMKDLDYSRLIFGDQLLRDDGSATVETLPDKRVTYYDFSAGILNYSEKYWIGASFHHLNRPNESISGLVSRLPIKTSVHGGITIPVKQDVKGAYISSISVATQYKAQLNWDQVDFGVYYKINPMVFGLWYRGLPLLKSYQPGYSNNDAVMLLVGYQASGHRNSWMKHLSIGYSFDYTISQLITNTDGSHEVSIIYEFANPRKRKRRKMIVPCAKF